VSRFAGCSLEPAEVCSYNILMMGRERRPEMLP